MSRQQSHWQNPDWQLIGRLPTRGARARRLALYAAHRTRGAAALHRHAIAALRAQGFAVLWLDAGPMRAAMPDPADALLSHTAATPIAAWLLACRMLSDRLEDLDQVLFASDRLVGPILPADALWASLSQAANHPGAGCWSLGHADGTATTPGLDWFALGGATLAHTLARPIRHGTATEETLIRALRAAPTMSQTATPRIFLPADRLRGWTDTLPDRLAWAAAIARHPDRLGPGLSATSARRFAPLAQHRLRALAALPDPRPGLVWWPEELAAGLPFLRRDLLCLNPAGTPELALLPDLLPRRALTTLAGLIGPTLPAAPAQPASPFRLTRAWLADMTRP